MKLVCLGSRSRLFGVTFGLALGLSTVLAVGCSGGDGGTECNFEEGDDCDALHDCLGARLCSSSCTCQCDFLAGAGCERNSDCTGGATCNLETCQCQGLVELPAHSTNCTTDADGCLVGEDSTCYAEFDAPLAGTSVTVHVEGALFENMANQAVNVRGFVGNPMPPYFSGYTCEAFRDGYSGDGSLSLEDVTGLFLDSLDWVAGAGGEYPFQLDFDMDSSATSGSCGVTAAGAPTTLVTSSAMGTAAGDALVIEAWRARICRVTVTAN